MSKTKISPEQRERIAGYRCCYCRSGLGITGGGMVIDHIIPEARGGSSEDDNLCFSCGECNNAKGDSVAAVDPGAGEAVPLYHPIVERWGDHFTWGDGGTRIIGITPTGRATERALKLNRSWLVVARRGWVEVGWHPPYGDD